MTKEWIVTIEEDEKSGELLMPFPPDLLTQMGWHEGTELWWVIDDNGLVMLKDSNNETRTK